MLKALKRFFTLPAGYDYATGLSREDRKRIAERLLAQWQARP